MCGVGACMCMRVHVHVQVCARTVCLGLWGEGDVFAQWPKRLG